MRQIGYCYLCVCWNCSTLIYMTLTLGYLHFAWMYHSKIGYAVYLLVFTELIDMYTKLEIHLISICERFQWVNGK